MTDTIPAMIQDLRRERDEAVDRAIYAEAELARQTSRADVFEQAVCFDDKKFEALEADLARLRRENEALRKVAEAADGELHSNRCARTVKALTAWEKVRDE